jgi:hypothetical protein
VWTTTDAEVVCGATTSGRTHGAACAGRCLSRRGMTEAGAVYITILIDSRDSGNIPPNVFCILSLLGFFTIMPFAVLFQNVAPGSAPSSFAPSFCVSAPIFWRA